MEHKHPFASLTIWGVLLMVVGNWWPDAAVTASNPDFWEAVHMNWDSILESLGVLLAGFGIRRRMTPGLTGFFQR